MQLLEGREEDVLKIFAAIETDERHKDVKTLWHRYVQFRDFPDWSMGFQNVDKIDVRSLEGYTPFLERDFHDESFCENSAEAYAILFAFKSSFQESH